MASCNERCSTGIWSSMSICLAMPARARPSSPFAMAISICSPSVSFCVLSLFRLEVARCLTASTRPSSPLTSSTASSTSRMAWAMVASGVAFSTASRRACTLPPMTRVTREAIVSVMFLLPDLACLDDDFSNFENVAGMGLDHGRIVAAGAAGDGKPQQRRQQLEAALHDDLLDLDRVALGVGGESALGQKRCHDLRQRLGREREHLRVHPVLVLERADGGDERRHQIPQPAQAALVIERAVVLPTHLPDQRAQLVAWADGPLHVEADQPFHIFRGNPGRERLHLHRDNRLPAIASICMHLLAS